MSKVFALNQYINNKTGIICAKANGPNKAVSPLLCGIAAKRLFCDNTPLFSGLPFLG